MLEQGSWRNFGCENVRFKSDKVCLKALPSTWTLSTFSSDSSSFVSSPCQSLYDSEVRSSFKGFHWQVSPTGNRATRPLRLAGRGSCHTYVCHCWYTLISPLQTRTQQVGPLQSLHPTAPTDTPNQHNNGKYSRAHQVPPPSTTRRPSLVDPSWSLHHLPP